MKHRITPNVINHRLKFITILRQPGLFIVLIYTVVVAVGGGDSPHIFMRYTPTPSQHTSVYLDVLTNPALMKASAVARKFDSQSWNLRVYRRMASYLAEAGMNLEMGNGFLYGLRGQPDVPPNIEVKWSKRGDKLIVPQKYMEDDLIYVLATGYPTINYLGWASGKKITRPYLQAANKTWYLRADELNKFPIISGVGQGLSHPAAYASTMTS